MSDQKKSFEKTYRVFLYQHIKHGWISVIEQLRDGPAPVLEDYIRISEPCDVTFKPLQQEEAVQEAMRCLDAAEHKARMDLAKALSDINDKRASLLALTHQPEQS